MCVFMCIMRVGSRDREKVKICNVNTSMSFENGARSLMGLFTLLMYATGANAMTALILLLYSGRKANIAKIIVVPIECPTYNRLYGKSTELLAE